MIIHNATFMVRKEREGEVISWLKKEIANMAAGPGGGCQNLRPRLSVMREAGGVSHHHADAASIAFQTEFEDEKEALGWRECVFNPLADRFTAAFGEESMVFTSLFEIV